jgi:putative ABC transport system substrate-binding protein
MSRVKRREFIKLLGGATAAWPLAARAQQPAKLPVIGFLGASTASALSQWVPVFVQRLRDFGWAEGRNIAIEYRWAEGRVERLAEFASEFVWLKVDVIVAEGTAATLAAKQATTSIPIVFPVVGDPLGNNLVASLARPGGNVTGLSIQATDLAAKRLELLREIVPGFGRLAVIANADSPNTKLEMDEVQAAARALGLEVTTFGIRRAEDIAPVFEAALKALADALYVPPDPLVLSNSAQISALALRARLPTVFAYREYVEAGGLLSYGPNLSDMFRRAAYFVDKILRGAKPGEIPVEQPTKFDLFINLKTAKALGLATPEAFLLRADEVIE